MAVCRICGASPMANNLLSQRGATEAAVITGFGDRRFFPGPRLGEPRGLDGPILPAARSGPGTLSLGAFPPPIHGRRGSFRRARLTGGPPDSGPTSQEDA
jgi:hypothetical protein